MHWRREVLLDARGYFCVSLKRFSYDEMGAKRRDRVRPTQMLTWTKGDGEKIKGELRGVLVHDGARMGVGHYRTYVRFGARGGSSPAAARRICSARSSCSSRAGDAAEPAASDSPSWV